MQPVMRSLRRNHGRPRITLQDERNQGDGASGTEWRRARSNGSNPRNRGAARKHPVTEQCEVAVLTSVCPSDSEPNVRDERARLAGTKGDLLQVGHQKNMW